MMNEGTPPDPVDLSVLRERAQTYILGLEAKLRDKGKEVEKLREQLNSTVFIDNKVQHELENMYVRGWTDATSRIISDTSYLMKTFTDLERTAKAEYVRGYTTASQSYRDNYSTNYTDNRETQ